MRDILGTLVHEMCHQWQHELGNPSRSGYHNKEWGNKMKEVGLSRPRPDSPEGVRPVSRSPTSSSREGHSTWLSP